MRRYQKLLALTLVGTGAFMLPGALPVQAATVQAGDVQAAAAAHGLQKVTAVTRVYGSGEQVAAAILEYPKALLPDTVLPVSVPWCPHSRGSPPWRTAAPPVPQTVPLSGPGAGRSVRWDYSY